MKKVIAYKNVFDRESAKEIPYNVFFSNPQEILDKFNVQVSDVEDLKKITDKPQRNQVKRELLPAVDLSGAQILSIDIDGIGERHPRRSQIIEKLTSLKSCYSVMESVSGNLVAFFQYDCSVKAYPYLYYKIYLELTLLLGVNIDFLPEINRLRYVGAKPALYLNEDSEVLTEVLEVENLPYINTQVGEQKARRIIYGSN